jgi:uncharacterized membrane protein YdcZ (DUF606 family)
MVERYIDVVEITDPKEMRNQRRRERWAYIIGLFAVVFLWRAIWDWSEQYFSTNGSFIVGLILVGIVAWLQKDHVRDLF